MAENIYHRCSYPQLATLGEQVSTVVTATPATYGCTPAQATALSDAVAALVSAISNQEAARSAYRASTEAKINARLATIAALADVAGEIYATDTLTSEQIAATGLAVHNNLPTPSMPSEVLDVVAFPSANGNVKLSWDRNGNLTGTTFIIEYTTDMSSWNYAGTTTRSKITLGGYAPGVTTTFRVTAVRNETAATPSLPVTIYQAEGPSLSLLAA